jgi:hypothetical protein
MVEPAEVAELLDEEAARLDASRSGSHRFNNIRKFHNVNGANWTANYGVRAGTANLRDALQLGEMRAALERIQKAFPIIRFD